MHNCFTFSWKKCSGSYRYNNELVVVAFIVKKKKKVTVNIRSVLMS